MNGTTNRNTNHKSLLTAERKYFILQKTVGVISIIFGIATGILIHDVAPLLACFIGAAFLFSKDKILMATDVYWDENPVKNKKNIQNPMENSSDMCYNRRRDYVER